jgi:hypothetical protein
LGKAAVLVAAKKNGDAVRTLESLLNENESEDAAFLAKAYNLLGTALRQSDKDKDALFAFLHVDLLYSPNAAAHADPPPRADAAAHAEALYNLAELWEIFHRADRAEHARQTLEQQYKDSPWTRKLHKTKTGDGG